VPIAAAIRLTISGRRRGRTAGSVIRTIAAGARIAWACWGRHLSRSSRPVRRTLLRITLGLILSLLVLLILPLLVLIVGLLPLVCLVGRIRLVVVWLILILGLVVVSLLPRLLIVGCRLGRGRGIGAAHIIRIVRRIADLELVIHLRHTGNLGRNRLGELPVGIAGHGS